MSQRKTEENFNKSVGLARMQYDTDLQTKIAESTVKEKTVALALRLPKYVSGSRDVKSLIEDSNAIHKFLSSGFEDVKLVLPEMPADSSIINLSGN